MRVRAKANGSEYEVAEELGRAMVKSGIYVVAEVDTATDDSPKYKTKDGAKYKRRDMTAEG